MIIPFHSNASAPYFQLSNYYQCLVKLEEGIFPSVEHAYQYRSKINGDVTPWLQHGDYSNKDKVTTVVQETKPTFKKLDGWFKKHQIGILALTVIRNKEAFDIQLKPINPLRLTYEFWKPMLLAKYTQNEELKQLLLSTGENYLLEFSRGTERQLREIWWRKTHTSVTYNSEQRQHAKNAWNKLSNQQIKEIHGRYCLDLSPWKGQHIKRNDEDIVLGLNIMGHFLMLIREELRRSSNNNKLKF